MSDMPFNTGSFHDDSIWCIQPNSNFESVFTGGRNGAIYHTDLVNDCHNLLYKQNKCPITSMCLDEENMQLWFSNSIDSSLKCLDLFKRDPQNSNP